MEKIQQTQGHGWWGLLQLVLVVMLVGACVTTPRPAAEIPDQETAETMLKSGPVQEQANPWPNQVRHWEENLDVAEADEDTDKAQKTKYRSWDFNYDGHADMLQVMGDDGVTVKAEIYDFDGDGQVDHVKELK